MLMLTGCQPRTGPTPSPVLASDSDSTMDGGTALTSPHWPFWPTTMRIHPLTRLTTDAETGRPIIECRIEFADADGQISKAVGQLTVQLYPDSMAATGSSAMETWNQDLRDLAVNRRQYDDVTRTYLFRLHTSQPIPAGSELRAYFLSADDRRMNAEMRVRQ